MGWKTLEKPALLRTGVAWLLEGSRASKTPGPTTKVKAGLAVTSRSEVLAQRGEATEDWPHAARDTQQCLWTQLDQALAHTLLQ